MGEVEGEEGEKEGVRRKAEGRAGGHIRMDRMSPILGKAGRPTRER